ncbi:ubiquinol-cytochrome c reductase iron-sulfur subunit [Ilumatobacter nonamiensis]|uniref:ubiquinol-cytochrome c reductase iron-sulfur subunit n=1 Tax=Ilumatobacter nonamiensis TaxID=467093 RepID=UPI00034DB84F|nr:Rieske 2Fe-2S domain-containing protein [Ilumatobacter nonamiensis]
MTQFDDAEDDATPVTAQRPVSDEARSEWSSVAHEDMNLRAYRAAIVAFVVAVGGGLLAAIAYWTSETETLLGVGLALALGGIGFGLVSWSKYLDLDEHVVQQREPLRTTPQQDADFEEQVEVGRQTVGRRKLLVGLLGGSFVSLAIGFVGPVGSLGPRPRGERDSTGWAPGRRLVTLDGSPVDLSSGIFDQLATVFPDGMIGRDDSQVVLLRLRPELLSERTIDDGALDGWVAYSKICTHAGCSVGLFGVDDREPDVVRQLVCPCHQSVFDPTDGARPVGGPATRSLPQLSLGVDDEGFLVSNHDFDRPVGPITWDEG